MSWSKKTWERTQPIYNQIISHPFIKDLIDGTLDKEKFLFYIQQDAIYLAEYGKVLAGIASRLNVASQISAFLHFAGDTMSVENALHESFLKATDNMQPAEASPGCLLYTSYLQRQFAAFSIEIAVASVLPCFWIYKEVGDYILQHQTKESNPYQSWIDTYGGEEYAQAVEKAIAICDELADNSTAVQQEEMTKAFIMCSKMEWIFWNSAYKLEQWSI